MTERMAAMITRSDDRRKKPAGPSGHAGYRSSFFLLTSNFLRGSGCPTRSGGRDRTRSRLDDDLRTSGRAGLRREAALQRAVHFPFDGGRGFPHHFGDFRDDEELGAIQHALLAER